MFTEQTSVLLWPQVHIGFLLPRLFDPMIAFFQIHAYRLLEVRKADLPVTVLIHGSSPRARFFTHFRVFVCTYYATETVLFLGITTFFDYSVGIICFPRYRRPLH